MSYERALELFYKYKNGTASDAEKAIVEKWLFNFNDRPTQLSEKKIKNISHEVWSNLPKPAQSRLFRFTVWVKVAVAASLILGLSFTSYLLLKKPNQTSSSQNNISPGHYQATLVLANGKKILLTKGLSGNLAREGNTLISVNGQNAVAYTAIGTNAKPFVFYNTLSTTTGEQSPYPLLLADGTKVWLNAESSITFPTAFHDKERIVKITGEAYFEVAHNKAMPFKVITKSQQIEVLGTHFNVNAYDDEPSIKTTLLEGLVSIRSIRKGTSDMFGQSIVLIPGQQAIQKDGKLIFVKANIESIVAWKNGMFNFQNANIQDIMRQISRWYDLDIAYEGVTSSDRFTGEISRQANIEDLLQILEISHVHFRISHHQKRNIVTIHP